MNTPRSVLLAAAGLALALLPPAGAADAPAAAPHAANLAEVQRVHDADLKAAAGRSDRLVLPGLLADRTARRVRLLAETTGIKRGETVEFFLIGQNSGHDYESLAVSFARPSDVHKALEFIGLQPGRAADPANLRFRPKGERVFATLQPHGAGTNAPAVRVEDLVADTREAPPRALPRAGLVFIGSLMRPESGQTGLVYAADALEPQSLAANYNEAESVLDVPREAAQRDVYGSMVVGEGYPAGANRLVDMVLEPEYKDGRRRCMDVVLSAAPAPGAAGEPAVLVRDGAGKALNDKPTPAAAVEALTALVRAGRTPFVALHMDDALTLNSVRALCGILTRIDTDDGVCLDAPEPGCLFYRAFLPNEKFRDRAGRISQPWELRLAVEGDKVRGVLTQIEQVWRETEAMPELRVHNYPVAAPEALRRELEARGPGLPVILVFAPPPMTHGQLMGFLRPVMKTHPTIHVFVENASPPAAKAASP